MDTTTFTISLDSQHLAVLDQLCAEQGLTRSQLLRQGLRLYQAAHLAPQATKPATSMLAMDAALYGGDWPR